MIPPDGTYRVDLHWVLGLSLQAQNVLYFVDEVGPMDQASTDALATSAQAWASTELVPPLSVDTRLDHITVTGYDGGGVAFQSTNTTGASGARAAESPEPPQVAVGITWRTALPTKSGRGRSYIPGPSSTDIGGAGQVFDPLLAGLIDAAAKAIDETYFLSHTLVVWSRTDALVREVISATVQTQVKTQTRRLR